MGPQSGDNEGTSRQHYDMHDSEVTVITQESREGTKNKSCRIFQRTQSGGSKPSLRQD